MFTLLEHTNSNLHCYNVNINLVLCRKDFKISFYDVKASCYNPHFHVITSYWFVFCFFFWRATNAFVLSSVFRSVTGYFGYISESLSCLFELDISMVPQQNWTHCLSSHRVLKTALIKASFSSLFWFFTTRSFVLSQHRQQKSSKMTSWWRKARF